MTEVAQPGHFPLVSMCFSVAGYRLPGLFDSVPSKVYSINREVYRDVYAPPSQHLQLLDGIYFKINIIMYSSSCSTLLVFHNSKVLTKYHIGAVKSSRCLNRYRDVIEVCYVSFLITRALCGRSEMNFSECRSFSRLVRLTDFTALDKHGPSFPF